MSENLIEKVERDGNVAVLVSPGHGSGWSTWATDDKAAVFAPDVVAWVEAGKPAEGRRALAEKYGYTPQLSGLDDVEIQWVPKGSRFMVDEYDGWESVTILDPDYGYIA